MTPARPTPLADAASQATQRTADLPESTSANVLRRFLRDKLGVADARIAYEDGAFRVRYAATDAVHEQADARRQALLEAYAGRAGDRTTRPTPAPGAADASDKARMSPQARYDWIEAYLREHQLGSTPSSVDVLDASFVNAYLTATGVPYAPMPYGAHKCVQLGRDLSLMAKHLRLSRARLSIDGGRSEGFPSWVYIYRLR